MKTEQKKIIRNFPFLSIKQENFLKRTGFKDVEELLRNFPSRYEDRGTIKSLSEIKEGEYALVKGRLLAIKNRKAFKRNIHIVEAIITDEKSNLLLIWFNQPWLTKTLHPQKTYYFFGRISLFPTKKGLRFQMENPEFEEFSESEISQIVPQYKKIGNLSSKTFREYVALALNNCEIEEVLPTIILRKENFPSRKESFLEIHFPKNEETVLRILKREAPSVRRFIFEELFSFQYILINELNNRKNEKTEPFRKDPNIGETLRKILPFNLTKAQKRVFKEIVNDCSSCYPMYRLLQGDVGSGKTIIAFLTMLWAALDGYQAVFMAPTETLATQVFLRLKELSEKCDLETSLLISSTKKEEKREIKNKLKDGSLKLLVGTHALFQDDVEYKNLNLVVIDEQHRFGVLQREALFKKGKNPHLLLMSATPIPRSLALTIFGDLDISVLDELPPNRAKVVTAIRGEYSKEKVYDFLKKLMDQNKQVLYVFPAIEDNESIEIESAKSAFLKFSSSIFKDYPIGLLHGKLSQKEKDEIMLKMRNGEILLLIATTVIEVGVDLPQATAIVIENAERFGLAQLHQLRGRVGRGGEKGYCILMVKDETTKKAEERLRILTETDDGFKIAEADLKLRGSGEPFGTRQWGDSGFTFANPLTDLKILESARNWATQILKNNLILEENEEKRLKEWIKNFSQDKLRIIKGG